MDTFIFLLLSGLAIGFAILVVTLRNPVSSALALVMSFVGLAGLYILLEAFFLGTIQILVYGGAIMVLFLFIIMLLDLKAEEKIPRSWWQIAFACYLAGGFGLLVTKVILGFEAGAKALLPLSEARGSDVKALGTVLFESYHYPIQIVAVLLLVATVGVVILSKKNLT